MDTAVNDRFGFDNSYARLPDRFYARLAPAPVSEPQLLRLNRGLAAELGLDADWLASPEGVEVLAGNRVAEGSEPIAMAYAGHQFGGWSPQLGDGRAHLLGEVLDAKGRRRDIQLKGSGTTPYSRMGDGRAPLGPVLREMIVSEAMAALGIPTSRALAAVATGEAVARDAVLPGAVLTRVASSHIRIGTFQFFYARDDVEGLERLTDHVIARHYPELEGAEVPALALLGAVMKRQADLVARWMSVGFIHGVMNTDNMTVSGETIDYGPCAFMDAFRNDRVFSSIDRGGRYAYGNQPQVAHWNLAQLAQALLPLVPGESEAAIACLQGIIDGFPALFRAAWLSRMGAKIGLADPAEADAALIEGLLQTMEDGSADFTLVFRRLGALVVGEAGPRDLFDRPAAFDAWAETWQTRLAADGMDPASRRAAMDAVNPAYIPRNHRVEQALAAAHQGDLDPMDSLMAVLSRPFEEQPGQEAYAEPPALGEAVHRTFCGT